MTSVINAQNVSKKYILSHQKKERYTTLRDVLTNGAKQLANRLRYPLTHPETDEVHETFWALKDVSFDIQQGDRVGIIGGNGAGKSTLLKILSRITEPTTGQIRIKGRVASLLEVGTGFHPELTGRENIYLNGAILGMSKHDIKRKFDEIVAFAEVEKFLDTPVKRYSSGMYVRLAFAVAAHLEPEVLIVDEVLAVGDAQFQKKCLGKMHEVGADGRTILFVSHNMTALKSLCDKAIWLNSGSVVQIDNAESVVSNYLQNGLSVNMSQTWDDFESAPGNQNVRLHSVRVTYPGEKNGELITVESTVEMEFEFWNLEEDALLNLSVVLYNDQDVCIFNTTSDCKRHPTGLIKGAYTIPSNFLNDSIYRVRLLIVKDRSLALVDLDNVVSFEVHDTVRSGAWYGKWVGAVRPKFNWVITSQKFNK